MSQTIHITHQPPGYSFKRILNYLTIGYLFLGLYLIQEYADLRWETLETLQLDETYKRWSGFGLGGFMLLQWSLTWVKSVKKWNYLSDSFVTAHKWMGSVSPLFFYVHSTHFGFAYLFFLSTLFFSNIFLGFLNSDQIKSKGDWYQQGWIITHVSVSVLLTLLMFYHGVVAFYYK